MVTAEFPQAKLVVHPTNLGFCAGNNRAVPENPGRYILFLNADTLVSECGLDSLIDFADANRVSRIYGPKLINPDGRLRYSGWLSPNIGAGFFRNTPLGRLFPK